MIPTDLSRFLYTSRFVSLVCSSTRENFLIHAAVFMKIFDYIVRVHAQICTIREPTGSWTLYKTISYNITKDTE
jgi:hypothetical protein